MFGEGGGRPRCAVCRAGADVHCAADNAFLCCACDGEVHGDNVVAACHRRTRVSALAVVAAASSCESTTDRTAATATTTRRPRERGELVMEGWARRMGVSSAAARQSAAAAGRALRVHAARRMPLRVAMAASLWREVVPQYCSGVQRAAHALRLLGSCARVEASLVIAVASWMGWARMEPAAAVEGWGESF